MTIGTKEVGAIESGTYGAWMDVLDAAGHYPVTREDILNSIEEGVRKAVREWLSVHGLPGAGEP